MEIEEKLEIILKNQEIMDKKLTVILEGLNKNDSRANASMFIQGIFLADLLSWNKGR